MKKILVLLLLSACSGNGLFFRTDGRAYNKDGNGIYKIGAPYQVFDTWYTPHENYDYQEIGVASWYGPDFHEGVTANGEVYDMYSFTGAHRTLPLPSIVRVTNLENGQSVVVRVNDRGPFAKDRIIDVSKKAAQELGFFEQGTTKVKVEILANESRALKEKILNRGGKFVDGIQNVEIPASQMRQPENMIPLANYQTKSLNGKYLVQTGSFANPENATKQLEKMSAFGSTIMQEKNIRGQNLSVVSIGPFDTQEEALGVVEKLQSAEYFDCRIIQVKE